MKQDFTNILKFLKEIELLKSVTRHSWTSSGRHESVAEHSWRLAILAIMLEDKFPEVDIKKVVEMSLVHDFGENYEGDTPAFLKNENKLEKEEKAIRKIVASLPEEKQNKIINLCKEYNECKTPEAKFVKAIDKIEALIQHNEADLSTWIPLEQEFNLTYGKEFMGFHESIKEFRKVVDEVTREKIKSPKNKSS